MRSGILFYDKSKTPLTEKIKAAAQRYAEKLGTVPDTCFINPNDADTAASVTGIEIKTKQTIMRNHIWLGVASA